MQVMAIMAIAVVIVDKRGEINEPLPGRTTRRNMRDIRFRGKSKETGKMIQGYLVKHWERAYIAWGAINDKPDLTEVDPETVGQYTGLKDKHDKDICEGDIIRVPSVYDRGIYNILKVVYVDGVFVCITSLNVSIPELLCDVNNEAEIIGNIHETPELIKQ